MGIWAKRAGGAYLGPSFLCLPWLSTLGITYASSWAFGPAYAIFGVLMVLVGLMDPEDMAVVRGCLSPPVMAPVRLVVFSKREGVSVGYLLWMWAMKSVIFARG